MSILQLKHSHCSWIRFDSRAENAGEVERKSLDRSRYQSETKKLERMVLRESAIKLVKATSCIRKFATDEIHNTGIAGLRGIFDASDEHASLSFSSY